MWLRVALGHAPASAGWPQSVRDQPGPQQVPHRAKQEGATRHRDPDRGRLSILALPLDHDPARGSTSMQPQGRGLYPKDMRCQHAEPPGELGRVETVLAWPHTFQSHQRKPSVTSEKPRGAGPVWMLRVGHPATRKHPRQALTGTVRRPARTPLHTGTPASSEPCCGCGRSEWSIPRHLHS